MKKISLIFIFLSASCFAEGVVKWNAGVSTTFPLWIGAQAEAQIWDRLSIQVGYGTVPQLYSSAIGGVAANLGGNTAYEPLIESAFDSNTNILLGAAYRFSGQVGWFTGMRFFITHAEGKAGISDVLQVATGRTYPVLIAALAAQGKSQVVNMNSDLFFGEIHGGYSWLIQENLGLDVGLGVIKALSQGIALSTELPNFDASAAGNTTLRQAEDDVEGIIAKYGISPTITVGLKYWF